MNAPLDLPGGVCLSEETADPRIEISPEAKSFLAHLRRRNQILVFEGTDAFTAKELFNRHRREMRIKVPSAQLKTLIDPVRPSSDLLAWRPEKGWESGEHFFLFRNTSNLRHALSTWKRQITPRIWISYLDSERQSTKPVYIVASNVPLLGYQSEFNLKPTG